MTVLYNPHVKENATNLSINSDILKKEQEMKNWEIQNKNSINSYNERVAKYDTFSNGIRRF